MTQREIELKAHEEKSRNAKSAIEGLGFASCFCLLTMQDPSNTKAVPVSIILNGEADDLALSIASAMGRSDAVAEMITKAFIFHAVQSLDPKKTYTMEEILEMANIKTED